MHSLSQDAIGAAAVYFLFNLGSTSSVVPPCPPHFNATVLPSSLFLPHFSLPSTVVSMYSSLVSSIWPIGNGRIWTGHGRTQSPNPELDTKISVSPSHKKYPFVQKAWQFGKYHCSSKRNALLLVLPIDKISLWPELSGPPRFRIKGGVAWAWQSPKSGRTDKLRKSFCLI